MANFIRNTFVDAQTTVTSLGAAFAGVAAEEVSNRIILQYGGAQRAVGLGQVGVNFILRSVVAAVAYSAVATVMPETSQNFFFGALFFASNPGLIRDARDIASIVLKQGLRSTSPGKKVGEAPAAVASGSSCSTCIY